MNDLSLKIFSALKQLGCFENDEEECHNMTLADVELDDIPMMVKPIACDGEYVPIFTSVDDLSVAGCMSDIMQTWMQGNGVTVYTDCKYAGLAFCLDGTVVITFNNLDDNPLDVGLWIFSECDGAKEFAKHMGISYESMYDLAVKTIKRSNPDAILALQELSGKENVFPKDRRMFRIIHETESDTVEGKIIPFRAETKQER